MKNGDIIDDIDRSHGIGQLLSDYYRKLYREEWYSRTTKTFSKKEFTDCVVRTDKRFLEEVGVTIEFRTGYNLAVTINIVDIDMLMAWRMSQRRMVM